MDSIHPVKSHTLANYICKQEPVCCCIQEMHLSDKDRNYRRVKDWKTIFQANSSKKQTGLAIEILKQINFQLKLPK